MQYSQYYRTFSNVLMIRTVTDEYLIVMKLMAGRRYKYDLSDVIGVLLEHEKRGTSITLEMVKKAAVNLYGSYDALPENSRLFIEKVLADGNYEKVFEKVRQSEKENEGYLLTFQEVYPDVANTNNVDDILAAIRRKKENQE